MNTIKSLLPFTLLCIAGLFAEGQSKIARDTTFSKVDSLKAAIVTATTRPRMKGDTLEYNTEHIQLQPNAVVEELLRRLPGLHVEPDGTITYNGEKIQHLLVDGEDIFGDAPAMVTRNFDASKVARIQILERKSEQTLFSGIDDGTRTKTLNLILKENAKNGYFGKVEAGGNTDGYYNANAALAAFRDKEQLTALSIAANTGVVGFSNTTSGAALSFMNANADALGASAGNGIPRFDATALHYSNNWNASSDHLMANYQYSQYYTQPVTSTQTLQTQPGSNYFQRQLGQSINQQNQHWMYGVYDWAPNKISACKFTLQINNSIGQNRLNSTGSSSFNDTLVNSSLRSIHDKVTHFDIRGGFSYRTQLGTHTGRNISMSAGVTEVNNTTNGYLYAINHFYPTYGLVGNTDTVDQRKEISNRNLVLGGSTSYIEPTWKGASFGISYSIYHTGADPLQTTYAHSDGIYEQLVDSLSSHFRTQNVNQRATLNLQGSANRLSYTIGCDWLGYSYSLQDMLTKSMFHQHNSTWAPRILFSYTPDKSTGFEFNYVSSTQQPSLAQLTPAQNNNDPLHITLGNPNLQPGINQDFKLDIHSLKTWLIDLTFLMDLNSNSISTKTITDSLGRQISQPLNVNGGRSASLNFSMTRKILDINAGIHNNWSYIRTMNYVNSDLSRNKTYTAGGGFTLDKYVPNKYSIQLNADFIYFAQVSSINSASPVHYWTQSHSGAATLYLVKNFEIGTNAIYTWQQKTTTFSSSTSVFLWNSYISRLCLHNRLTIQFQFNNICNANAGVSRSNAANINTQTSMNILGRYWMASATYHFDKKFKKQ